MRPFYKVLFSISACFVMMTLVVALCAHYELNDGIMAWLVIVLIGLTLGFTFKRGSRLRWGK